MENTEQVLVIIVSSVLSLFLILLIVTTVYVIKLLRQLRRIGDKAESMADSVESAADMLGRSAGSFRLLKLIAKIVSEVNKSKDRKGR